MRGILSYNYDLLQNKTNSIMTYIGNDINIIKLLSVILLKSSFKQKKIKYFYRYFLILFIEMFIILESPFSLQWSF